MASEKTTTVDLVVNDESKGQVDLSEITAVEVRGATGVASYRLDPTQDTVIKIVVIGKVAEEGELPEGANVTSENVAAFLGSEENIKNLKQREKQIEEDRVQAEKDAEQAAKDQGQKVGTQREREHVGEATIKKEPASTKS